MAGKDEGRGDSREGEEGKTRGEMRRRATSLRSYILNTLGRQRVHTAERDGRNGGLTAVDAGSLMLEARECTRTVRQSALSYIQGSMSKGCAA